MQNINNYLVHNRIASKGRAPWSLAVNLGSLCALALVACSNSPVSGTAVSPVSTGQAGHAVVPATGGAGVAGTTGTTVTATAGVSAPVTTVTAGTSGLAVAGSSGAAGAAGSADDSDAGVSVAAGAGGALSAGAGGSAGAVATAGTGGSGVGPGAAGASGAGGTSGGGMLECGGMTPHGCYVPQPDNQAKCPPNTPEQSAYYPPMAEWNGCNGIMPAAPFAGDPTASCAYKGPMGQLATCLCDTGLHWLCTYPMTP